MINENEKERICLVTAFIDIGREEWTSTFTRSNKNYLNAFLPHLQLHEELIIFLDVHRKDMKDEIENYLNCLNPSPKLSMISPATIASCDNFPAAISPASP